MERQPKQKMTCLKNSVRTRPSLSQNLKDGTPTPHFHRTLHRTTVSDTVKGWIQLGTMVHLGQVDEVTVSIWQDGEGGRKRRWRTGRRKKNVVKCVCVTTGQKFEQGKSTLSIIKRPTLLALNLLNLLRGLQYSVQGPKLKTDILFTVPVLSLGPRTDGRFRLRNQ